MKRVYILRHAKAEPASDSKRDFDRGLVKRGRGDAAAMGKYFHSEGYGAQSVYCSAAVRTRQTFEIFSSTAPMGGELRFLDELYLAEVSVLLQQLRSFSDENDSVMLVGHNPGSAEFALLLARSPVNVREEGLLGRLREKFSTCALAVIDLDVDRWSSVLPGKGALADLMRPRDLN